ncbi:guanylate kinase [bacterium]|nr:guanylate kinase [bacterium]
MQDYTKQGKHKLVVFSAPSGSGKTTVVRHLLDVIPDLEFSISATTRPMRAGEKHGQDYYFYTNEEFQAAIEKNAFIEYEEVYKGVNYGTLKTEVHRLWEEGKTVIFDLDVEGGLTIKKYYGEQALALFLRPPSVDILIDRLRSRNTENEEQLTIRIAKVHSELKFEQLFDKVIVNDVLSDTFVNAESIVTSFLKSED